MEQNLHNPAVSGRNLTRRAFVKRLLAGSGAAALLGGAGYSVAIEPIWVQITRYKMVLRGLAPAFEGYRLVHISDPHFGAGVPTAYLADCMVKVNGLSPDLVVVTGDLVHHHHWCMDEAADVLALLRPTDGVLVALGNHDCDRQGPGIANLRKADAVTDALTDRGQIVLRNRSHRIARGTAGLAIVGLEDIWSGRFNPAQAFHALREREDEPIVALSHNPDTLPLLLDTPAQWVLSGHTHGGQIDVPFLGPPRLPIRNREFAAGHIRHGGKDLFVNRGLGWFLRVRFNARPEITLFELTAA